jgi:hypothetical protein
MVPSARGFEKPTYYFEGKNMKPIPMDNNGRSQLGRFAVGHKLSTGNTRQSRVQHLRSVIADAITDEAARGIILAMINRATEGDVQAAKLILGIIGKPTESDVSQEINDTNFEEVKRELLSRIAETN